MNDRRFAEPGQLNLQQHQATNYPQLMLAEQRRTNQLLELLIQALAEEADEGEELPRRDLAGRLIRRG